MVLFGATGFTGRLTAHYLARRLAGAGVAWAVAGRTQSRLDELVAELADASGAGAQAAIPGVVVADAGDLQALRALAARTRVVATAAGPYTKYGSLLVQAAAEAGTHYADLSGEFFWERRMMDQHEASAVRSGAKIVFSCGYDSVPFDLGALVALRSFQARHPQGQPARLVATVRKSRGWLSGGTLSAITEMLRRVRAGDESMEAFRDPYLLVPNATCRPDTEVSGWGYLPRWDRDTKALAVQHFMAGINARVVRRSLALLPGRGLAACRYAEAMSVGSILDALWFLAGHWADLSLAPKPGQGPPPGVLEHGEGRVELLAMGRDATQQARAAVWFRGDMGYNCTSKMLAEAALCLADPACHARPGGGMLTPATAMGHNLVQRLEQAEGGHFMGFELA